MPNDKYDIIWNDVWEKVKTYNNVEPEQVNAFFSRLVPQAFSEGFFMLTADTKFIKDWVEKHYLDVIKQALEEIYGISFTVAIEVDTNMYVPQIPSQHETHEVEEVNAPQPKIEQSTLQTNAPQNTQQEDDLISEYCFENFVVGSSNKLAYSMALAVAETPGENQLNPLFIYGKSGLGKTHLLRSIQNYVKSSYPYMKTIYVDTMELVSSYTDASISKNFASFKEPYDQADMVLIDDVQGLQGKEGTINMVFQIINNLKDNGKQIVLSADRAPKNIGVEERYQSRFGAGGICDIQPPEMETKLGIIRNFIEECKKRDELHIDISPEIQNYVAHNSSSNIRELKSAITKIIFYVNSLGKTDLSVEEVSQMLRDHFSSGPTKRLNVSDIQKVIENYYQISHADLIGKKRSANIAHARQVAIYLCRKMIDIPFESIGKEFNRDHTTAMYSVTTIEEKLRESRELNEEIEIVQKMIVEQ